MKPLCKPQLVRKARPVKRKRAAAASKSKARKRRVALAAIDRWA